MSLNTIILSIVLIFSFHNVALSMQEESIYDQKSRIVQFIHEKDHNLKHMEFVGQWLTIQRNNVTDYEQWNSIVNLITSIGHCRCDCLSKKLTFAIKDIIKQVAHDLQPGQDCSQLLVTHAQKALEATRYEWNEEKITNDLQKLNIK